MMRPRFAVPLAAMLLAAPLGAQQWRTVDVSRQLRDSSTHDVRIRYGAGRLSVRPTDEPVLFAMHLRYDEDAVTPVHRYDPTDHTLTLGLSDASIRLGRSAGRNSEGELRVALSRHVPMNLDLELGAAQARLDLGGLALREVKIETGASDSKIVFATPNPSRMRMLDVSAGAASLELSGLGNANVEEVRVKGGVGKVAMDFSGRLLRDVEVTADMALGRVELAVPRDAGVKVELSRFLAGFEHFGLEKREDGYYSDNWDRATRRITVAVKTVLGSISVTRID
jgi:hypothetical protein